MKESVKDQNACLNCEKSMDLSDCYCKNCGQKKSLAKVPVIQFLQDFLGDYFSWDSKIFKSIVPLLIKPGYLTNEYVKGKRAKFIPPFRVFIIVSVIFFLLFSAFTNSNNNFIHIETGKTKAKDLKTNENASKTDNDNNLAVINLDLGLDFNPDSAKNLISKIGMDAYVDSIIPNESKFQKFAAKQFTKVFLGDQAKFGEVLVNYSSKLIFLMLPLFALLLKLIYIRKKKYFYEHFIFSLHLHTFIFIYLIFNLLFVHYVFDFSFSISILLLLIYLFMAMKKVYCESYKKTISSFVMLSLSYLVLFIPLFFLLLLFTSLVFY
ncbi:MAG: DUF3667 domain-containing protein [Bacteroidota bacterium]|nr:DUF3667 domain-containing protein [Bacteroidota bacterium]